MFFDILYMSETEKDTKSTKNPKDESIGDINHGLSMPNVDETKLKAVSYTHLTLPTTPYV